MLFLSFLNDNFNLGFLQSLQQSSSTYSSMITVFCNRLGWFNLELLVNQFHSRLMFGVQRQLLDLVRIKLLNSHRARLFYNAGFNTVASLAMCDLKKIEKILRTSISYGHGKRNETESDSKMQSNHLNNSEAVIWSETKGYTYWEASVVILKEASEILQKDLELLGVKIKSEKTTEKLNKTSNKTSFDFNETFDSMIQTQKNIQESLKESIDQIVEEKIEKLPIQSNLNITEKSNDLIEKPFVIYFL